MSYTLQYNKFIESETGISKTNLRPRNLYRINSYKYKDGTKKTLAGVESAIVFIFGKTNDKFFAIKLNDIRPEKFFMWFKNLLNDKNINWDTIERMEDAIVISDLQGKSIHNRYILSSDIYKLEPTPYRTYNIKGIGNIEEIKFKKDILKSYL
jgi:hypothetical protein